VIFFLKIALTIAGIGCILLGLLAVLIVVNMFQHPGGIGMEALAGPVVGVVALAFFVGGGVCFYVVKRIGKRPPG
jgi:hypothetical protein